MGKVAGQRSSLASYDMGLSTVIGDINKDANGHRIQNTVHSTMQRLRTWDYRIQVHHSKERNLKRAFSLLYTLKYKFNLTDVAIENAAHIYRKVYMFHMGEFRQKDI